MHIVAVVVPVYKQVLSELEIISYIQLLNILGEFDIVVIAPQGLKLSSEVVRKNIKVEYFPAEFFLNVDAYSSLMLSGCFYERFLHYQYILIYQLDAFVFGNELMNFCRLGYDYIGAPWISGFCEYTNLKRKVLYVGNGGFSLRRVKACIDVLDRNQNLLKIYQGRNEDAFFSACDSERFRVAPKETALTFSFEREVRACFEENHRTLPFGCHAWERYDFEFWKEYIENFGYELKGKIEPSEGSEDLHNSREYQWMRRNSHLMESDSFFYGIPSRLKERFREQKKGAYYLWGAGYVGRYAGRLFRDLEIDVKGYVDTDLKKQGQYVENLKIYSPEVLRKTDKVIITVDWKRYAEIERKLSETGFVYLQQYIFFEDILPEG